MKKIIKGFTFIELLVVVTIIATLVTIAVISYVSVNKRSRDAKRKSDIEQLRSALEMYRADYGYYPDGGPAQQLMRITSYPTFTAALSSYIATIPEDPKDDEDHPYKIQMTDRRGTAPNRHDYGYCLAAYMESQGMEANSCSFDVGVYGYNYGAKNP